MIFNIKSFVILILALFVFSLNNVKAQTISSAETSAQQDLKKAIENLKTVREKIAAEKIPLASRINQKQTSLLNLRSEAAKIQAAKDSKTLGLEDLRNDLKLWQEENTFLVNLLDEYARRFESDLNPSEIAVYDEELGNLNKIDLSDAGENRISVQMQLIDIGFSRLRNALNGNVYEGKAITEDGELINGTFAKFGPNVYFQSNDKEASGIVLNQDKKTTHLFTDVSGFSSDVSSLLAGENVNMPVDVTNGRALSIEVDSDNLFDHIGKGGIWIIPILAFAGLSTIASVLKLIQIYKIKLPEKGSLHTILSNLQKGNKEAAIETTKSVPYPIGGMLAQGIKYYDEPKELVEEAMYESVLETQPVLEKYLPLIAISAATAPLLGLLGTVTGMINTFQLITLFGTGDAQALSSGISEALITTEFGLIVAIPALIIHALLSRKIHSIMSDMEKFAVIFVNGLPRERA